MGSARRWHWGVASDDRRCEPIPLVGQAGAAWLGGEAVVPLKDVGLTHTLNDLEGRLDVALGEGPRILFLDLSAVVQVSSTTITALLWTRRRCSSRGVEVVLRNPSRRCQDALRRAGLLDALAVEDTTPRS